MNWIKVGIASGLLSASLLNAALGAAQDTPDLIDIMKETSAHLGDFNCTASQDMFENHSDYGGLDAIFNFKGDKGKGTKTYRTYTIRSAEYALQNGYNYAIMAPLSISNYRNYREVVRYGWGTAYKDTQTGDERRAYELGCTALDDVAAFDLMWDMRTEAAIGPEGTLVDLRRLNETLELGIAAPARVVKIREQRYQKPGDRERIAKQYDVKRDAASCRTDLRPVSLKQFKPDPAARNLSAERACLAKYEEAAKAVGWDRFPLAVEATTQTVATNGYDLNRPKTVVKKETNETFANPTIWGKDWIDLSSNYQGQSDKFLHHPRENLLLIASQNLDETQTIDRAVFISSEYMMSQDQNGVGIVDKTSYFQDRFRNSQSRLQEARLKTASKTRKSNVSDRDIQRKTRDIERAQARIQEIRSGSDDATIAEMKATMAAFPGAAFDEDALRKQLKTVRETNLKARETKLNRLQQELAELKSQHSLENSQNAADTNAAIQSASQNLRPSVDLSESNFEKGVYHAFETYSSVLIVKTNKLRNGMSCRERYLVCADKLQAYNALGDRVGKIGFTTLSLPVGYEAYEAR